MESQEDFNKKRKRGLWILWINLILSLAWVYYQYNYKESWWLWASYIYFLLSIFLLVKRYIKIKPKEESNYIFGEKLGGKMEKTPQKFILEAMLMSLSFIILTDIFSMIWAIFFTDIGLVYKVIAGVSGFFGAIFMTAILITTFIQYKQFMEVKKFQKQEEETLKEYLKGGNDIWQNK